MAISRLPLDPFCGHSLQEHLGSVYLARQGHTLQLDWTVLPLEGSPDTLGNRCAARRGFSHESNDDNESLRDEICTKEISMTQPDSFSECCERAWSGWQ